MKSVLETIQGGVSYFEKHGVESARLNMEHLLAHVLECRRMDLYVDFDRPLGETELAPLRDLVRRRAKGEPLQHILGVVEFHGREFRCDTRGLVPRPETEQLVELVLERVAKMEGVKAGGESLRILDMGTGSGVIGLSLAAELPPAEVVLADISEAALSLARENSERLSLAGEDDPGAPATGRLQFIQTDLFAELDGSFDVMVANLPYLTSEDMSALSKEVGCDPSCALDGGPDGLDLIRRFVSACPERIRDGGLLALEIGAGQAEKSRELVTSAGFPAVELLEDYSGIERFLFASPATG